METIWMIQKAFGDDAVSARQIKVWHKDFKDGWDSVENDPCSVRPATSRTHKNAELVWAVVSKDRRLRVRELEADLGIPKTTVSKTWHRIWTWNVSWQNSFCSFCYQNRRNIVLQLLMTWFKPLPMNQISSSRPNQRWIVGLQLWSGNEGPVVSMDVTWFSTPKEGVAKLQQDQDHLNCVFWLGRGCASWVCPSRTNN